MEEAIRFIKQSYRLEDMRLLNYARLKNMAALVVCAAVFASGWMGLGEKLEILRGHVIELSQRIHKVPAFFYYAIADGIQKLFTCYGNGWGKHRDGPSDVEDPRQLLLELSYSPG